MDDANALCLAPHKRMRLRRRLLSSSSSSSSSSDGGGRSRVIEEENDGTDPTPYPTVRRVIPPSLAPVVSVEGSLKDVYCECESDESFDDYFYYNSEGELTEFGRNNHLESAKSERGGNSDGIDVGEEVSDGLYAGMRNDESVIGDNMMMSKGWRCGCRHVF